MDVEKAIDAKKAMDAEEAMHAEKAMHAKEVTVIAAVSLKIYYLLWINTSAMDATLPRRPWQEVQVVAKATLAVKNKIFPWPAMALP